MSVSLCEESLFEQKLLKVVFYKFDSIKYIGEYSIKVRHFYNQKLNPFSGFICRLCLIKTRLLFEKKY